MLVDRGRLVKGGGRHEKKGACRVSGGSNGRKRIYKGRGGRKEKSEDGSERRPWEGMWAGRTRGGAALRAEQLIAGNG